jgi:hypothetical protein
MDRLAEADGQYHIHRHATKGIVQISALGSLALPFESGAQGFGGVDAQSFGAFYSGLREGAVENILARLGFSIGEEAKARAILVEALVQTSVLVPAVLVVVDVVVGLGVGEVELSGDSQHRGPQWRVGLA